MRALGGIRQRADAVDARIASFHQLSRQRFYYQSQMRGRRPEMARALCEAIDRRFAGQRFSDIDGPLLEELVTPWRGVIAPVVELFHGTASLRSPRRVRQPASLRLTDAIIAPPGDEELDRLREQMRVAVTPKRAARLVRTLLPHPGDEISTSELKADTEEAFLDLMAAASFDRLHLGKESFPPRHLLLRSKLSGSETQLTLHSSNTTQKSFVRESTSCCNQLNQRFLRTTH